MDSDFGEVLRYLDEHGLSDDTIVIFMGDNGGAQFMAKGTLYENGIRVPFMIRWPGRIAPAVTDAVVSNVDIASTCLGGRRAAGSRRDRGQGPPATHDAGRNPGRKVGLLRAELPRDQFAAG